MLFFFFFNSGLLINTILTSYKPKYIAARPKEFVDLIETCENDGEKEKTQDS